MVATSPAPLQPLSVWLERLDTATAVEAVERLLAGGAAVCDVVADELLPAWQSVDDRCAAGVLDPGVSGAAAAVARRALAVAVAKQPRRAGAGAAGPVAVVSPSAGPDLLLAEAAAALASATGHQVDTLAGATAVEDLAAYLAARRPALLIASAQSPTALPLLAAASAAAHAEGIPVLAWGGAFGASPERARLVGTDGWAAGATQLTSTLEQWRKAPPRAGALPAAAPGGAAAAALELETYRSALLAAADGAAGDSPEAGPWARRAAQELVDHLAAAVAVGDRTVLTEHLERQRRGLARRQLHDVHLVGLVEAVGAALPLTAVAARHCLFSSREELRRSVMRPASPGPGRIVPLPSAPGELQPTRTTGGDAEAPAVSGQTFADLLLLAALSCQTSFAVLSVPQGPGRWRTLGHGFEQRTGLDDPGLFELMIAADGPIEIPDLSAHPKLARSPLAQAPHQLRWAYGIALRPAPGAPVLGVVAVMDRWLRELSRREQRALAAVARQAAGHLAQLRRGPVAGTPAPSAPAVAPPMVGAARPDPASTLVPARAAISGGQQHLLRSHEVAVLFDVTERTVINWAAAGKLPSLRTIGGHLRFRREDVMDLLAGRTSAARAR